MFFLSLLYKLAQKKSRPTCASRAANLFMLMKCYFFIFIAIIMVITIVSIPPKM